MSDIFNIPGKHKCKAAIITKMNSTNKKKNKIKRNTGS